MSGSDGEMAGALAGVRVIELAQNLAIPSCGRILAAMGADVIKIEPPAGDAARTMAPFPGISEGRAYTYVNQGKRSVVLDLADPGSHTVRDALLRSADVVLVAFKGPDLVRFGVAYDDVAAIRPDVIYLDHRALGAEGPDADEGGYDVLVQGLSGLSFITSRSEGGRPVSPTSARALRPLRRCSLRSTTVATPAKGNGCERRSSPPPTGTRCR
jgi:crotonobetainyl-CoA:carnitine CoA-transferase CaiB-like acyl-CoA transferase